MCRNLMFISLKPNGSKIPEFVLEDILQSTKYNDDGFALYVKFIKRDYLIRTLSLFEYARCLVRLENEHVVFLHTHQRAATTGTISVDNVHLWSNDDIMFSHNGYVIKYASHICSVKFFSRKSFKIKLQNEVNNDSDSKRFFFNNTEIIKKCFSEFNIKELKNLCKNEGLSGIIMLNDSNGRYIALGIGKAVHLYVLKKYKAIVISNIPMHIGDELQCEYVYGEAGKPKFTYKRYKQKIVEKEKGFFESNWYWYDWYS